MELFVSYAYSFSLTSKIVMPLIKLLKKYFPNVSTFIPTRVCFESFSEISGKEFFKNFFLIFLKKICDPSKLSSKIFPGVPSGILESDRRRCLVEFHKGFLKKKKTEKKLHGDSRRTSRENPRKNSDLRMIFFFRRKKTSVKIFEGIPEKVTERSLVLSSADPS